MGIILTVVVLVLAGVVFKKGIIDYYDAAIGM